MAGTSLYDFNILAHPQRRNTQTLFLRGHATERSNGYQNDLMRLQDGKAELLVSDITAYDSYGDQLFYQQDGQLFRFGHQEPSVQLTNTKATITQFFPQSSEKVVYLTQVSSAPAFNEVTDEPAVRRYTKRHYKVDNSGFIDESQWGELRVVSNDGVDQRLAKFNRPVKLLDVSGTVALVSVQVTDEDADEVKSTLVTVDLQTRHPAEYRQDSLAQVLEAQIAPDGQNALVVAFDTQFPNHRAATLHNVNLATGAFTQLFDAEELLDGPNSDLTIVSQQRHVRWLNNQGYLFETGYFGHTRLYQGDLSGNFKLVSDLEQCLDDFWPDAEKVLAVQQDTANPSRLVEIDVASGMQQVIYDANGTLEFERAEKFTFASEDGSSVDAWFMAANSPEPAPVVLYVHGGPHAAYGEAFFWEFQQFVAAGYNVVFTNPHGSTTYGQDFINAVVTHYGEQDYRDVLAGLDAALARYADKIDANKQVIIGGSYGGFMTTWAIGHTNRFKTAVSQRPVTDWLSFTGASDIGYNFVQDEMGTTPYTAAGRSELIKRSPLTYANRVTTPLLMMHGEYDLRTPIAQTESYYVAMKTLTNTPVEMVRFPQAWHGVSRNGLPNLRNARLDVMFDWLQRTL